MSRSEFSVAGVSALEPAESLLKECDVFRAAGDEANPLAELAYQAEDRVGNLVKMKGDYHRYLVEFKTGDERKDATGSTLLAYKAAQVQVGRKWILKCFVCVFYLTLFF